MTSTIQPPSLNQEPGTPAHEWAQQTVGAVGGAADTTKNTTGIDTRSNATTPGNELPGAFPRTDSSTGASTTTNLSENAKSAAASVQQQAAPVFQSASQTAGNVFASAEQAARTYLPASVVGTLEGAGVLSGNGNGTTATKTSLPSQEKTFTPSAGGVGSLPGSSSEADVAKLPEERALESQIGSPLGREGVFGTSQDTKVSATSKEPVETKGSVADSRPLGGPSTGGPKTASQFLDTSLKPAPSAGLAGTDLHHITSPHSGTTHSTDASSSPLSPDRDAQKAADAVGKSTTARAAAEREKQDKNKPLPAPGGNTNTLASTDDDQSYARDQGKREPARTSPNHAYTPPGTSDDLPTGVGAHDEHHNGHEHARDESESAMTGTSGESGSGKPSLKQKIKGEAKVIAGKLSKDPKKVEAGKAMKEGHSA